MEFREARWWERTLESRIRDRQRGTDNYKRAKTWFWVCFVLSFIFLGAIGLAAFISVTEEQESETGLTQSETSQPPPDTGWKEIAAGVFAPVGGVLAGLLLSCTAKYWVRKRKQLQGGRQYRPETLQAMVNELEVGDDVKEKCRRHIQNAMSQMQEEAETGDEHLGDTIYNIVCTIRNVI